eukprot:10095046-Alexandrium_andersonii.AAC.1
MSMLAVGLRCARALLGNRVKSKGSVAQCFLLIAGSPVIVPVRFWGSLVWSGLARPSPRQF